MKSVRSIFVELYQAIKWRLIIYIAKPGNVDHKKLHLGCGTNLIPGWVNVDLSKSRGVTPWDLTKPFPIESGSIDYIYSEHFIEHITREQAKELLFECYRVLRVGGVFRISTPDLKKLVNEYLSGNLSEWSDLGWNPASPCALINEGMRLWDHQFLYDVEELTGLIKDCGFSHIEQVAWRDSGHAELKGLECRPFHGDLILECVKYQA